MKRMRWTKAILGFVTLAMVFYFSTLSCLAAEGKVIADTAKIRAEADTNSEVVGSTVKGKVIDILGAVKDSSGTVWYKVPIANNGHGYIRSDLVQTSETITATVSAQTTPQASTGDADKPEPTVPTSIGEQKATVKSDSSVRIRSGASTKHDPVGSLTNGTVITLIGEANDSAGNKWYQMTCDNNGKKMEGYIRSDLITIGAAETTTSNESTDTPASTEGTEGTEGAENTDTPSDENGENSDGETGENPEEGQEAEPEQPEEPENVNNDYEVVYAQDDTGEYTYYLYNNLDSTRQKVSDLLSVVTIAKEANQKLEDVQERDKLVIIILAVIIVILIACVTVLIIKLRNAYYEDYDEDDEEEEPVPVRRKAPRRDYEDEYDNPAPVRKKRPVAPPQEEQHARPSQPRPKTREPQERRPAPRQEGQAPAKRPARKPQNFLVDDDEFEFEFLNMDDKDL